MTEIIKFCTIIAMITFATASTIARPRYIECIDSLECAVSTCCTVGMGKYSIPKCQRRFEQGESCRPASEKPYNVTLSYPDGQTVEAHNIYSIQCPCADGLFCSNITFVCEDPYENFKHNMIDFENDI